MHTIVGGLFPKHMVREVNVSIETIQIPDFTQAELTKFVYALKAGNVQVSDGIYGKIGKIIYRK